MRHVAALIGQLALGSVDRLSGLSVRASVAWTVALSRTSACQDNGATAASRAVNAEKVQPGEKANQIKKKIN